MKKAMFATAFLIAIGVVLTLSPRLFAQPKKLDKGIAVFDKQELKKDSENKHEITLENDVEHLIISMIAKDSKFDTFLKMTIKDKKFQDDDGGEGLNSLLHVRKVGIGKHTIIATSFGMREGGSYEVKVFGVGELKEDPVKGFHPKKGGKKDLTEKFRNRFPFKSYEINLAKGTLYKIELKSGDFDALLGIRKKGGKKILAGDDDGGDKTNSRLFFVPASGGEYEVLAASLDGRVGNFELMIIKLIKK